MEISTKKYLLTVLGVVLFVAGIVVGAFWSDEEMWKFGLAFGFGTPILASLACLCWFKAGTL